MQRDWRCLKDRTGGEAPRGGSLGRVGVKEIERLIRKLELDKEILADEGKEAARSDADA